MALDPTAQIGPYRIIDTLGEGGMGVVYLAEQFTPVQRQVALKLLKPGADSEQVLARFETERQALAVMDHPSIAKVFDAGVTEDGESYFVMELVTGLELAEFCDEGRLTVRERVGLFVDVCHAVQHAHQKGVIHRDLKPSNVLVSDVDGRPLPRVIDFGIAKATQGGAFVGAQVTRDDQVIGTPAYMSLEQIDGSVDVDTRTDVYALGVLLFEILSGALPYEPEAYRGWASVVAHLQEDPPTLAKRFAQLADTQEALSGLRSTTPAVLRRELAGDLGWIVARAMEGDRELRYETVNAMAIDLQRHLDHEPVRARGASTAYVLQKFVRRHRLGVGFASTVALGLIGFSIVTSIQAERIARARDEADARRGQAEGLIEFMLGDLRDKLEPIGRLEILDDVGDQAIQYFSSIPEDQFSDEDLASRSQALYQIGEVRLSQGSLAEAETAFTESLRLARALAERDPGDSDRLFGQSQSHFWVGYAAWLQRDLATAESEFEEYMSIAQTLVSRDSVNAGWQIELGYAHSNLGSVREERRDLDGALEAFRANLAISRRIAAQDPANTGSQLDLAVAHNKLGVVLQKVGDLSAAADQYEANLAVTTALVDTDSTNAVFMDALGLSHIFLGDVRRLLGDEAGAGESYRAYERVFERLARLDPENIEWAGSLAIGRRNVAGILLRQGDWAGAEAQLASSLEMFEKLAARDPDRFEFPRGSARTRWVLASLYVATERLAEALAEVRGSVQMLETILARGGRPQRVGLWLGESRLLEGDVLQRMEMLDAARTAWEQALARTVDAAEQADALDLRARALMRLGRTDESNAIVDRLTARGYRSPELAAATRGSDDVP